MGNLTISENQKNMDIQLEKVLDDATNIITKNYLGKLERYDIKKTDSLDTDIDVLQCGKFYKVTKIVNNKEENFIDKMKTVINVASGIGGTIATIIKSDGDLVEYYLGIICKNAAGDGDERRRDSINLSFKGAIEGNFIGSELNAVENDEYKKLLDTIFEKENKDIKISSISGIATLRSKDEKNVTNYVQGIENLVDSLKGQKYSIIFIADPMVNSQIENIKRGYEIMHSELSKFLKNSITINENETSSLSTMESVGFAKGMAKGIAMTQNQSHTVGQSKNHSIGGNLSIIVAGVNYNYSKGRNYSETKGYGTTNSYTESYNQTSTRGNTSSISASSGKSFQINYENRMVKSLLDKIDKNIERLENCENFGAFECAAYVIKEESTLSVASNYNALMKGENSFLQGSYINEWYNKDSVEELLKYLKCFEHPKFYDAKQKDLPNSEKLFVSPASIMNGEEVAIQVGLPKKSILGLSVIDMASFGRNIIELSENSSIELGNLYHMGKNENSKITLDIESLASHAFITGSTGSGKSNTIYKILDELQKKGKKFLVIEPAKGEYKNIFGRRKDVNVFGTNPNKTDLLRINPFKFPEDIHILEHIDRLIEIFNVCWPMYAAMPAVLKEAIENAYKSIGWDLSLSENKFNNNLFPNFNDLLLSLNDIIKKSAFSQEVKDNYSGALLTRVKSLTNGINGQIFSSNEINNSVLFDENTIIDLSRVGSIETKAMIMGIIVMKLQEYRMNQGGMNLPLKHITILEEAHNLLRKTSFEQNSDSSNLLGKSVEMISNVIAEIRTYGEGFIIADQSPGLLDMSVIRNTNTKIIMRLPDLSDRELVGKAIGLNNDQINELSKLETGVAAVYQNNWFESVLCKVDYEKRDLIEYKKIDENINCCNKDLKIQVIQCLLSDLSNEEIKTDVENLKKNLINSNIATNLKVDLLAFLDGDKPKRINDIYKLVSRCFNVDDIFEKSKDAENIDDWNRLLIKNLDIENANLSDKCIENILECIIKYKSNEISNDVENYNMWMEYMERRIL